jgi:hypothetical protein
MHPNFDFRTDFGHCKHDVMGETDYTHASVFLAPPPQINMTYAFLLSSGFIVCKYVNRFTLFSFMAV